MTVPADPILIDAFERVQASRSTTLLRVAYRLPESDDRVECEPTLVVGAGADARRLAPLPAPPAPVAAQQRRAAYAIATELVDAQSSLSLELPGGLVVDLPEPALSKVRAVARVRSAPGRPLVDYETLSRQSERLAAQEEEIRNLRRALADDQERLGREIASRSNAETEAADLRNRLAEMSSRADESARELAARCSDLERRLADTTAELQAVIHAEQGSSREARRLRAQLQARSEGLPNGDATPDAASGTP